MNDQRIDKLLHQHFESEVAGAARSDRVEMVQTTTPPVAGDKAVGRNWLRNAAPAVALLALCLMPGAMYVGRESTSQLANGIAHRWRNGGEATVQSALGWARQNIALTDSISEELK